ncbi:MAG: molecular chaperone DnaJ [Alphaproteobacteria bacterium]|nr:molecular chaperone DnaJ [Alphaproteobacteria bacterium]
MSKRDYYEVLGVTKSSSAEEIKKSYRKIAMQYHPDRNPGDKKSEELFKEAAEAYDVLSDADKKSKYDRFGHQAFAGASSGGGGFNGNMDMNDIFQNFGDIFGDSGFGSFFGGNTRSGRSNNKGTNLRIKIKLNYDEISKGVTKTLKVKKQVPCSTCRGTGAKDSNSVETCKQCNGTGQMRKVQNTFLGSMQTVSVCTSCGGLGKKILNKCADCHGEGKMWGEDTISINIPPGVYEGLQLNMPSKGNAGERGGSNGDLLVIIEEEKHPFLQRDGMNVLYELNLSFIDAVLGIQIEVPSIDGKVKIKIPPGTQSGKIFRLKGKGFPEVQGYAHGDQLIYIHIWTPQQLSNDEKNIIEKFKNSPNFKPQTNKGEPGFFDKLKEFFK